MRWPVTVPPVFFATAPIRAASSDSTRVKSAGAYRFASGNVATWTRSPSPDALAPMGDPTTCHSCGTSKRKEAPRTVCHAVGAFGSLDPPQPARMSTASTSACLHRNRRGIRRAVTRRKEPASMAKTKDKVYDAADNVKPYVQRAMSDEKLRDDVMSAFSTAKELYNELIGGRGAVTLAARVATDDEIREKLRDAIDDLRNAADRLQGKKNHGSRTGLLVAGIALGILFNPVTGPETRKWLKEMIGSGGDDFGGDYSPNGGTS